MKQSRRRRMVARERATMVAGEDVGVCHDARLRPYTGCATDFFLVKYSYPDQL